ncbi:MAG: peptidylprolyl isomerase [Sedimentisphaerales bacterium]
MTIVVNGEKVEDAAIRQEVVRLRPEYERVFVDQDPKERETQLFDWSKENVIERVLISQDAQKNGGEIPPDQIASAFARLKEQYADEAQLYKDFDAEDDEKIKKDIEMQMRVERTLQRVCDDVPKPSNEAIQEFYDKNKEQYRTGERVRVAHIVKYVNWQTDEETAYREISEAHEELTNGASFEAVVDKYTDCADSGGDLGFVSPGQMVEEFEDVVFNLGEGQISDVFRSRFGFHIAKVYTRQPAAVPPLEEVKERVTEDVKEQMRSQAIDAFIDQLRSKATIEEA